MSEFMQGFCVDCGNTSDITVDHVIPRCLFPGRIPKDALVVAACPTCNGVMKSSFDAYLRDLLVVDTNSYETTIAQQLHPKFQRAFARNQSNLMRDFLNDNEILDVVDTSGNLVKHVVTSEKANEQIENVMVMIERGLYHYYLDTTLPSNVPFEVIRVFDRDTFEKIESELYERGGFYAPLGDGNIFECTFSLLPEDSCVSIWLLTFYRSTMIMVVTGRESDKNGY